MARYAEDDENALMILTCHPSSLVVYHRRTIYLHRRTINLMTSNGWYVGAAYQRHKVMAVLYPIKYRAQRATAPCSPPSYRDVTVASSVTSSVTSRPPTARVLSRVVPYLVAQDGRVLRAGRMARGPVAVGVID